MKWWANTFEKGLDIADPESIKVQFTTSAKVFGAGKNLYRGPNHHYGLNVANDKTQSSIAGKVKVHGFPGDGRTIGVAHVYFMSTAHRDKEWAWKLLQYLGGRTKDGEYTQAVNSQGAMPARVQLGMQAMHQDVAQWATSMRSSRLGQATYTARSALAVPAMAFPRTEQIKIEVQSADRPLRRPVLRN